MTNHDDHDHDEHDEHDEHDVQHDHDDRDGPIDINEAVGKLDQPDPESANDPDAGTADASEGGAKATEKE
jgi:hypothetical protein